ncbi:MAG: radical SAM protein, partial [Candidatus Omnitrophica bacterium]|nr:radical SAM protein [Candidatus Omnitrophota bacterium]
MSNPKVSLIRLDLQNSKSIKHPHHCSPPFSLKYLEALLKSDGITDVRLYDALAGRYRNADVFDEQVERRPDIVVYFVNITTLKELHAFNARLKECCHPLTIAMGSIETKFLPEHLDIYLPGEAEVEIARLITRIESAESTAEHEVSRYRVYKQEQQPNFLVHDLDTLPFPQYSPQEIKDYRFIYPIRMSKKLRWGHVLSSRGCPYTCSFCSPVTRESFGVKARLRSAKNVVDEIEKLQEQGINMISFDDDLLTITRRHVMALCDELIRREVKINWLAHSRIDNIDYDMLRKMKEAGCVLLRFGVESGSARVVNSLTKSFKKIDWNKQAREIFQYAKDLAIETHALLIIGSPTETEAEIQET